MILSKTDVSMMNVRNVTGNPSLDLGTLCTASNDQDGYAFNIVENNASSIDGYLKVDNLGFPVKFPYYNIYSNNCCGEWVADVNGGVVRYRILRESTISNKYCYKLGSFGGYNSNAVPPSVDSVMVSFIQNTQVNKYPVTIKHIELGDYD